MGVFYGYDYCMECDMMLVLVFFGYVDGIFWNVFGWFFVLIGGWWYVNVGCIVMDQFVVDVGDVFVFIGDEVVLFGDLMLGVFLVVDWVIVVGIIDYEIVMCIGLCVLWWML